MSKVYFAQIGADGPIKIGTTCGSVERRLNALRTSSPWDIRLIGQVSGSRQDERSFHTRFSRFRLNREWFAPSPELLREITTISESGWEPQATKSKTAVAALIDAVGGVRSFSIMIGCKLNAATKMRNRGRIPACYWWHFVQAAKTIGRDDVTVERLMAAHEFLFERRRAQKRRDIDGAAVEAFT